MTKTYNAYHNAFYAKTSDDLKYKKDRCVHNNFEIRFSYHDNDIIIARSYYTDIATIDNENRRVIVSWSRYSHTTGSQIDELLRACPADYKIAFVPSENILGDYATKSRICEIMTQAGKDSLDWVRAHDYKVKDCFVIGCHRIPRAELESLRQLYTAAKAKHDAKVAA